MKWLVKRLKPVLKKNKEIIDLVLFGSVTKGAMHAADIDIAILTENEDASHDAEKEIKTILGAKTDIQRITLKQYDTFLWIALIREGYSIKHGNYLHRVYRIKPTVLYTYSLKSLPLSRKVMFERAIKNFKDIQKLSNRVVLVPIRQSGAFSDFLKYWDIDFDAQEYGLLPLMRKEES